MSLIKFKVSWSDDDSTFRDIEILSGQSYYDLHTIIKKELQLPATMEASFFVSHDLIKRGRQISSTVEKNLRDAIALSMKKTQIGALIEDPHQKFLYECEHEKAWLFYIDLITLMPEPFKTDVFPRCIKSEGISPSQLGTVPIKKDSVVEIEERYDLNANEEGFGDEGEDSTDESEEGNEEAATDEFGSEEI